MVTDQQVRRLMKLMTTEPTARKYRRQRQLPSQFRKERVLRREFDLPEIYSYWAPLR
jgi:hypothetical protein